MLVSYNWLKEFVNITNLSADDLAEKVTRSGIEVDGVTYLNQDLKGIVVGKVLTCEKHPDADKLNVTTVDIGEEQPVQIVCGAPNVQAGQTVVVAKVGARLPGGLKIKRAKLRGQVSEGMICSLQELGIEGKVVPKEYSEGIFVFPEEVTPGTDAMELLNLNDAILDFDLTPNRADCLNMIGVGYEVGAVLAQKPTFQEPTVQEAKEKTSDYIAVRVEDEADCPYYGAHIIRNVKIGPSPLWLQTRLMASGIRPINNVVDVTNYVLLEYGQPLHAFDYDRFGSKEVVVRHAKEEESIQTLDGEERTLKSGHLVITNGEKAMAVAGVMGGKESEVQATTTTVLLESALFNSQIVRHASKDLGLRSESSARFEKGLDIVRVTEAAKRACQLIQQLAGGEVLAGVVASDHRQVQEHVITITTEKINDVLGTDIQTEEIKSIFERLQFSHEQNGESFIVTVPTRRPDCTIVEDLIEEVGRLYGYDNIPKTLPTQTATPGKLSDYQKNRRIVRRYLEGCGLYQAITYSLSSEKKVRDWQEESSPYEPVRLSMPMSEEHSTLRINLVPHLLDVVKYNVNRQMENVAIFEMGSVFLTKEKELTEQPKEQERLAGVLTGLYEVNLWQREKKAVDFYVVKGIVEGLFDQLGVLPRISFVQGQRVGMHPGRTAKVLLDGEKIGFVGAIHPNRAKELDVKEAYVFELNLETLLQTEVAPTCFQLLPRYPSITRDIALVVGKEVVAGEVKDVIIEAGGKLLHDVQLFDVYEGENLEDGKKSLAFSLVYLDPERTLTDEEVTKAHEQILQTVAEKFQATLRQ
ncbi:phenylalanine--tRNA ligase subunit beta [Massilibacterium senegalense]|uniref:phenylalanine--tRNA ligase subunit beta n=1 Tax=Massilibacterium senegalense TaxID=1632858 RepID=UPI000782BEE3|nr:phenylalanine--tRNA ligase subunit beta [Massilibacterium senegalense]